MMEYWDLFDGNRKPLNRVMLRSNAKAPGEYNIGIEVWTVNSKGEILLTLRAPSKIENPNKWENTGGYVLAGESSRQGTVRELFEETGISINEKELILLGSTKETSSFMDIYLIKHDIDIEHIVLQRGETVDAKWVPLETLESMATNLLLAPPNGIRLNHVRKSFDRHYASVLSYDRLRSPMSN